MFDKPNPYNSISDIFVDYLFHDFSDPDIREQILIDCYEFLVKKIKNNDDYKLFNVDMKFDKEGDVFTLKGNNLISSLWLIGVYPKNPSELKDSVTYSENKISYIYNPKNKNLTIINQ